MKKAALVYGLLFSLLVIVTPAECTTISLFDWGFNLNGDVITPGGSLPSSIDISGFDFESGLGKITISFNPGAAGDYFVNAFFDHEIEPPFYDEIGSASGTPAPGQSGKIDEPGFVNGDIFVNFVNNSLDNGIGTSIFGDTVFPDDVSMAMGWNFTLNDNLDGVVIDFILSEGSVPGGFSLAYRDPRSAVSLYFLSNLETTPVPKPSTIILLRTGLAVLIPTVRHVSRRKHM